MKNSNTERQKHSERRIMGVGSETGREKTKSKNKRDIFFSFTTVIIYWKFSRGQALGKVIHMYRLRCRLLDSHLTDEETEAYLGDVDGSRYHG